MGSTRAAITTRALNMDTTEFHFDRRAIKRRMAISGGFAVLGLAAVPLFVAPPIYWLIAVCLRCHTPVERRARHHDQR